MRKYLNLVLAIMMCFTFGKDVFAQSNSNWSIDFGLRGFKYSADWKPNEIQYNPVFDNWERINQNSTDYKVSKYQALESLYFNMNIGFDFFIRYKKYLLIKVGCDYSNPFGIGGKGHIHYTDNAAGRKVTESKEYSYTSHQINCFVGPVIQVNDSGAEIYLAFSPMPPTWINYKEKYTKKEDGQTIRSYDKKFTGMFGSCRGLLGMQVPVGKKFKLGSEVVFTVVNYMKLTSGSLEDYSFRFPNMKWNFTMRYELF